MKLDKTDKQIEAMPLVENMRQFAISQGINITRQEAYQNALEAQLVDVNGNPTQFALDNGLVEETSLTQFDELDYPFFVDESYNEYVEEQMTNDNKIMSKRDMYELMYQAGLIFPNGKPTPKAIKNKDAC